MIVSAERGRVWILEDSPLEAELARRALSISQDVEIFAEGTAVLERLSIGALPDMIVVDWQLPGITGVEVCRVIRATHDAIELPLLMLTGHAEKQDVVEALAAGANDYVVKPYDMSELIARVGTLVRTTRLQRAQVRRSQQLSLAADIGEAITKAKNLEEIAKRCTHAIATHLDAASAEVWVQRHGQLELFASTASDGSELPQKVLREVAASQTAVITDDLPEIGRVGECSLASGVLGFAALPLIVREETLGVVAFCSRMPIGDAVPALTTIADLLALGIARIRADEERALMHERERNARGEAEAANRSKDEFLAMVSHELRTPLNAITGWTSMLLSGGLEPERVKKALETIERNARSQAQLIDDLLDIGRIISGKLRVDVGTVDVPLVAEMAFESVRLAAVAKGISLEAAIEGDTGTLKGDADRIQQIIWNLLSNAIKFTSKGGRVVLYVRRDERGIVISVDDSGQGIPPEFLPHVFERFKQVDGTVTRAKGGLGLGLAIVKHLAELHGGTVEARSPGLGKGSTFLAILPASGAATETGPSSGTFGAARVAFDRPREVEGLRVLVLDDEADALDLIRTLLESCKITVTTASNAADAFEVLKKGHIDVILSDIGMPVEDGFSFIRRVRALPREEGGRVPAVAVTAYARLEDRTKALRAGFNSHVAKPVAAAELLAVLSSLATL